VAARKAPEEMRSDAQENRSRILEVALEALTGSGDVSLNQIAKRAGVGPGTLYRHFPTREALVLEVYRYEVGQLAESAPRLLAELGPAAALRVWFDRLAHYGMTKAGLGSALAAASSHDALSAEAYGPVIGALTLLLNANEEAGTVRPGLDPDDVLLILGFLWRIDPASDWRAQANRILDILVDGLRAGAPNPPGGGWPTSRLPLATTMPSAFGAAVVARHEPTIRLMTLATTAAPASSR
jgi:AcrR family transcriptional regulator